MSKKDEHWKKIAKEALQEWLDGKFAEFGRWTFYGILAMALVALIYFILKMNGWKSPI